MTNHDIETVLRRKLKFDDAINGNFCKAFYTHDEAITRPATQYHKVVFNEDTQKIHHPSFQVYTLGSNIPTIIIGFRQTINFINAFDLKTFRSYRKKLKK